MTSTNRRTRTITLAVAGATTLLISACSSSSTPVAAPANTSKVPPAGSSSTAAAPTTSAPASATASGPSGQAADPCSLLTQSEVDAAAGKPLGPGAKAGALGDCQWSSSDFAASVELDVADWSTIKAQSTASGQPLTAVSGVGDEAWALNRAGNAAQLYVHKGSTGFLLLLGGGQYIDTLPDLGLSQEKVLAAAVLGRL